MKKIISGFCAPIQNTTKFFLLTLVVLFDMIRHDAGIKMIVDDLRSKTDKKQRDEIKKNKLFAITFSGIFSKRSKDFLKQHSGLICVDIDKLGAAALVIIKAALERLQPYLVGYFLSPSGDGYKVILRVDYTKYNHETNYMAAIEYLKSEIRIDVSHFDSVCKDVARACFVSHDPNAYLNEHVKVNMEQIPLLETSKWFNEVPADGSTSTSSSSAIPVIFTPAIRNAKLDFNHKSDAGNFNILLSLTIQKKGAFISGNRHNFIQSLASYANKFGMDKEVLESYCVSYFKTHPQSVVTNDVFDIDKELLPTINDVYTRYSSQFGSWLEEEINEEMETPCFPEELYANLPALIAKPASLFKGERERDVFLNGMLGVLSTWMPRVQGVYDGKLLAANLFIVISAPASAGKGTLHWARKLCKEVMITLKHNYDNAMIDYETELEEYEEAKKNKEDAVRPQKPLKQKFVISGNASSAAMITCIHANLHFGLIFETEADTLVNTLKNDWGSWTDILRKAFHHEPVSLLRKKDNEDIEIERPHLSMLLSGTPSQITNLVSSVENGFFSRILFYDFPNQNIWKNVFEKTDENFERYFDNYALKLEQLLKPYFYDKANDNSDLVLFELTEDQQARFHTWFKEKQTELSHIYGDDIIPSIKRLAVCFFRVALILNVMRHIENCNEDPNMYNRANQITCCEADYKNAELIINTLMFHTIKIFKQVKKTKRNKYSAGNRDILLANLPDEFNRAKAMQIAAFIGIKEKTAENYITQFIRQQWLQRVEHNQYKKIA